MNRLDYQLFGPTRIGQLVLANRLVRSATWDPSIIAARRMTDEVLALYQALANGGIGLIIAGGLPVVEQETLHAGGSYHQLHIDGLAELPAAVHQARPDCRIMAQLETGYLGAGPSAIKSPFSRQETRELTVEEIDWIISRFVEGIEAMREAGFDGVQLHAAHGGLLSCFLSPYTNRRKDAYGNSVPNRVRIVRRIVEQARERVGDWPLLIKVNGTDFLRGGIDLATFPLLARALAATGLDAIEISGGMWDCLARPESELGFRPLPAPESHTQLEKLSRQSYFLPYAQQLELTIPVILVGGNRDVERLESLVRQQKVDLVALCRPLIYEPDLPRRWLAGEGSSGTGCISCNSCIHALIMHPGLERPGLVRCVFKDNPEQHRQAQAWLAAWVKNNLVD